MVKALILRKFDKFRWGPDPDPNLFLSCSDPGPGSGSEWTWEPGSGSGSEQSWFGSTTLLFSVSGLNFLRTLFICVCCLTSFKTCCHSYSGWEGLPSEVGHRELAECWLVSGIFFILKKSVINSVPGQAGSAIIWLFGSGSVSVIGWLPGSGSRSNIN